MEESRENLNDKLAKAKEELLNEVPSTEEIKETDESSEVQVSAENTTEPEAGQDEQAEGTREEEVADDEGGEAGEEVFEGDGEDTEGSTEEGKVEEDSSEEVDTKDLNSSSVENEGEQRVDVEKKTDDTPTELDELKAKIEELEAEKEIDNAMKELEDLRVQHKQGLDSLDNMTKRRIIEECNRYGVPVDMDINEMKEVAPDKFNILQQIVTKADEVRNQVQVEMQEVERKKATELVFSKAEKELKKYKLSQEQLQEAAITFVDIMHETGIKNLKEDIAAKVELAVARAKMIKADIDVTVEAGKKVVEDVKEAIKDVAEETANKPMKKSLDEFKESATVGEKAQAEPINEHNVLAIWRSKEGTDRLEFFKEHQDLIQKAYISDPSNGYKNNGGHFI